MAFTHPAYQPPNQGNVTGLGSSHSALDGVPFKIGMAFRPPPKAILPPELLQRTAPCNALHEEYAYDTEEAVLAWARAREEAKVKATVKKEIGEKAKAAIAAARSESGSSDSEEEIPGVALNEAEMTAKEGNDARQAQPLKLPWQLKAASSMTSTILTPMPIPALQAGRDKVRSPVGEGKAQVDLALFEQEGDPFDALELQTLNDMEELKTLLGGSIMGGAVQEPSPNPDGQNVALSVETEARQDGEELSCKSISTAALSSLGRNDDTNTYIKEDEEGDMGGVVENTHLYTDISLDQSGTRLVMEPTGEGDYVRIRSDYSQQAVSFHCDSTTKQTGVIDPVSMTGLPGQHSPQPVVGKLTKHVLPPIRARGQSMDATGLPTLDFPDALVQTPLAPPPTSSAVNIIPGSEAEQTLSQSASACSYTTDSFSKPISKLSAASQLPSQQGATNSDLFFPSPGVAMGVQNKCSHFGGGVLDGPGYPAVNGFGVSRNGALRSAQSNPDLSISRGGNSGQLPPSQTQPWNPYKPLPPTPRSYSPDPRSGSVSSNSPSPNQRFSPIPQSSATLATTPPSEVDPYPSLSVEAQAFVNNLTAMGFLRSRAARAVEKFGADEKEVLDHLLNVDKLVEKKFKPELAETGLQLFRNDIKKAEQFLDLYQQFTELGFTADRIQTALVKHQLDRDKALDYLTT